MNDPKESSLEALPAYTYQPLQGDEVRVLVLEPSCDHASPLRVSFAHAPLNYVIYDSFEALSYTWGESILVHPVMVADTYKLCITTNLDQALRRLRHTVDKRRLWADALCINQLDEKEKSHQIPLMSIIFRSAKRVLAWLGAGGERESASMAYLLRLSRLPKWIYTQFKQPNTPDKDLTPEISAILDLPWFTRMWIIQEVVFNIDVLLIYDDMEISWSRFATALGLYRTVRNPRTISTKLKNQLQAIHAIVILWKLHSLFEESGDDQNSNTIMLDMLRRFAYYQCSDPRDRIFALYNMSTDIERPNFQGNYALRLPPIQFAVNYSLDVKETYHSFALACARTERIAHLLQTVIERVGFPDPTHWPSWVPDWRLMPTPKKSWFSTDRSRQPLYYISHNEHGLFLKSQSCYSNVSHASTQGPFVSISALGPTYTATESDDVDTFLRAAMDFYILISHDLRVWWVSKPVFLARVLASMLELGPEVTHTLEGYLSTYTPAENLPGAAWEVQHYRFRDAIANAVRGKTLFHAQIPGRGVAFLGVTDSTVLSSDQLLVDAIITVQTDEKSPIPAIILRPTPTHTKGSDTSPTSPYQSPYSFRVVGSTMLSFPQLRDQDQSSDRIHAKPELPNHIRVKEALLDQLTDQWLYKPVQFWLE